jgi:hypothetical protein
LIASAIKPNSFTTQFIPADKLRKYPPLWKLNRLRAKVFGEYGLLGTYQPHPDTRQESFFFSLLKECLEKGVISEATVKEEMANNHVRHDALELVQAMPKAA